MNETFNNRFDFYRNYLGEASQIKPPLVKGVVGWLQLVASE